MVREILFLTGFALWSGCSQKDDSGPSKKTADTSHSYTVKELIALNIIQDSVFSVPVGRSLSLFPKGHPLLDSVILAPEDPDIIKVKAHEIAGLKEGYSKIFCYGRFSGSEPWFFIRIVVSQAIIPSRFPQKKPSEKSPVQNRDNSQASLKVLSSPSYSQIYVDNVYWGTTPMLEAKTLNPGSHQIMVIHRRYGQLDSLLEIAPGELREVKLNFKN